MTRYPDDDDDDVDDDEGDWDDGGADDADDAPTIPCPSCRREILEDSPWCPHCERYLSQEDHPGPSRPLWVVVTAMICLGVAIWWVLAAR